MVAMLRLRALSIVLAVVVLAACGGKARQSAAPPSTTAPSTTPAGAPGVLQAEATSAASGDIPDNQVFLVFRNTAAGYSLRYPEGWAQQGGRTRVTFRDKNNIVRVVVVKGAATPATIRRDLAALHGAHIQSAATRDRRAPAPSRSSTRPRARQAP